jgi:cobyrinic acid a,c-diamide synthase
MLNTRQNLGRLVIGGTHSGVGKTTLVAGLVAALRQRGSTVQPFKVGPDYIDPSYHSLAAGRACRNLDTWMIPAAQVTDYFNYYASQADLAVVEGVMGVYDGQNYQDETGSTAQIAKLTRTPLILVLDISASARSAAAAALGFKLFDPALPLAGFILNYAAGDGHGRGVAGAVERATGLPVLGWLPRDPALRIPERHLGLIPTREAGEWAGFIDRAAAHVSAGLDLAGITKMAQSAPPLEPVSLPLPDLKMPTHAARVRIAVAQDEAFNFTYQENLDLLEAAGAEIVFFSPLHDISLPPGTAGVILSGGFPELYAETLSANQGMRLALNQAQAQGLSIYAECGGLMALTQAVVDLQGKEHRMFGLLPGRSVMTQRLQMGYRQAQAAGDSWLMCAGEEVRGHEFHYSIWEGRPEGLPPAYWLAAPDRLGEGVCLDNLWASYVHLSFWTQPALARRFVQACREG